MKTLRRFARIALACALLLAAAGAWCGESAPRPNILLILADDMGINDLGHINHGQTQTPNLDQLARRGVSFSRHYTESSCAPSRAALLTGMNPARVGFHPTGLTLPDDVTTLPELLRAQGYHTALFGKWHVGDVLRDDGPQRHGFDEWFGALSHFYLGGAQHNGHPVGQRPVYMDPWLQHNGAPATQYRGHIDDLLTAQVIEAISRPATVPWFIYVPFLSPHTPTIPAPRFAQKYPDTPSGRYRAVIEQLDDNIGAILKQVEKSGLADDTIVIFVSDNGGTGAAFPSNAPFAGEKATYGEGGIRTPLIVHWPRHWTGGRRIDDVKYIADIYPTLARALRLPVGPQLDGVNLFEKRQQPLFWYSQNALDDSYSVLSADGHWRLLGNNSVSELLRYPGGATEPVKTQDRVVQEKLAREYANWRDAATMLANPARPDRHDSSAFVANPFRPTSSIGFSLMLPAVQQPVPLIANRQLRVSYAPGEFVLTMDSIELRFPYQLKNTCNSVYLNFKVAQDNTIFYGAGISQVDLYVNGDGPITRNFKIDRLDSANFSRLTQKDFNTLPAGPIVERSIAIASRLLPGPEIAPALDTLDRNYCKK